MTAEQMFQGIADGLLRERSITQAKMFGAQGLRSGGKVFAFLWKQRLVVKLPQDRVEQLVREENAVRFDPGHGRVSKEWVSVAADAKTNWTRLVHEARGFVDQGSGKAAPRKPKARR